MNKEVITKRGNFTIRGSVNPESIFHRIPGVIDISNSEKEEDVVFRYSGISGIPYSRLESILDSKPSAEEDVITLASQLMDYEGQKKGIYDLEGATLFKETGAVILVGETLSGKSLAAYQLRNNYYVGGDKKALITIQDNKVYFVGGNRYSFPKRWHSEYSLRLIDFGQNSVSSVEVLGFIRYKHANAANYIANELGSDTLRYLLWPWVSKSIRGVGSYLGNMEFPLPSLDTEELSVKRLRFTSEVANITPLWFFEGSVSDLDAFLRREFFNSR